MQVGREACRSALRQGLLGLATAPDGSVAREAWFIDRHFRDWPLDEAAILDALTAWIRQPGRQLRILGQDFATPAQALPRFSRWRRDWSHRVEVFSPADTALALPWRGLLAGGVAWQWLDAPDWRMRPITEAVHVRATQTQLADFLQRCEAAWPVTTLGL